MDAWKGSQYLFISVSADASLVMVIVSTVDVMAAVIIVSAEAIIDLEGSK